MDSRRPRDTHTGITSLRGKTLLALALLLGIVGVTACGSVIPRAIRDRAHLVPFSALRQAPARYAGSLVLLGGEVSALRSRGEWIEIEILERPLGFRDHPRLDVAPQGKFAVWVRDDGREAERDALQSGRLVTVAGEVHRSPPSVADGESDVLFVVVARHLYVWPPPFLPGGPRIGIEFGYQGSIGF